MSADRDSDMRILTELCGWTARDGYMNDSNGKGWNPHHLPDFSSLDACFEWIVPAMKARGLEVVISCPIDDAFRVQLFRVPSPIAEQSEQGDTPAKAIVAATLAYLDSQRPATREGSR